MSPLSVFTQLKCHVISVLYFPFQIVNNSSPYSIILSTHCQIWITARWDCFICWRLSSLPELNCSATCTTWLFEMIIFTTNHWESTLDSMSFKDPRLYTQRELLPCFNLTHTPSQSLFFSLSLSLYSSPPLSAPVWFQHLQSIYIIQTADTPFTYCLLPSSDICCRRPSVACRDALGMICGQ